MWRGIIFAISITPLGLVLQTHRPSFVIVLDDSLSMQSTDVNPTRLNAALRLLHNIHSIGSFGYCYSLVSQATLPCDNYIALQKSGTSITDLVLLAATDHPKQRILVVSDNGANNGIAVSQLDQELQKLTKKRLMRTDIQPNATQLVISGIQIDTAPGETNPVTIGEYFQITSTDNDTIDILAKQQKQILLQQAHSHNLPINYAIWLFVLVLGALMSMQHFMEHLAIHRQKKKK
ncbi:MAG: hypothetical protein WC004_00030 [Candidatus Absconditabacterales bacterium]